jgi:hypothetical protein
MTGQPVDVSESTHVSFVSTHPDLNLDFHIQKGRIIAQRCGYDHDLEKVKERLEAKSLSNKRQSAYISKVF